jgi:hypothetical protein
MTKRRIAGWANRRSGGRRREPPIVQASITTRYRDKEVELNWHVVHRYRRLRIRTPDGVERIRVAVWGRTLATTRRPIEEFYTRDHKESLTAYVETHLPRPVLRTRLRS